MPQENEDHRLNSQWSKVADPNKSVQSVYGNSELPLDMRFNSGHILSIWVYSILMMISAIGNGTVLVILIRRRLKTPSRIDTMLMHLAIADLLVTFLLMPLEIGWAYTVMWLAGDLMCRIMSFLRVFGLYLSSFVLICISIDRANPIILSRYFAVIKPMSLAGVDRRGKVMLCIAWFASVICSTPQAIIFHEEAHPNVTWYTQCVTFNYFKEYYHEVIYSMLGMMMLYAIPLVCFLFCYTSIYMELYRKSKKCATDRFRRSNDDVLGRAKRKILHMTITIVIVFIVCWTPFYVISVWFWFDKETANSLDQRLQKGLFLFASTNSCMNPIVYGLYNVSRKRENSSVTRISNIRHGSLSKRNESIDAGRRNSAANSLRRTVCISCGEAIELPCIRNHNLYH